MFSILWKIRIIIEMTYRTAKYVLENHLKGLKNVTNGIDFTIFLVVNKNIYLQQYFYLCIYHPRFFLKIAQYIVHAKHYSEKNQ